MNCGFNNCLHFQFFSQKTRRQFAGSKAGILIFWNCLAKKGQNPVHENPILFGVRKSWSFFPFSKQNGAGNLDWFFCKKWSRGYQKKIFSRKGLQKFDLKKCVSNWRKVSERHLGRSFKLRAHPATSIFTQDLPYLTSYQLPLITQLIQAQRVECWVFWGVANASINATSQKKNWTCHENSP